MAADLELAAHPESLWRGGVLVTFGVLVAMGVLVGVGVWVEVEVGVGVSPLVTRGT